jgi:tetratricopeptide (TPR) repeat protein
MGQTAEDVRDNIVKIVDKNGKFAGTGFFIHKEYCVTCHHVIYQLNEIYVEREDNIESGKQSKRRYAAEWAKEFSDAQKDIAFLRVQNADFKPLQCGVETYAQMPVVVRGFPFEDLEHHPDGKDERGTLSDVVVRLVWDEEEVQEKTKEWNVKPKINVQVFNFSGQFDLGFSGAPVCYEHGLLVVGMFEARDANKGYIIPMKIVVEKFDLEKVRNISVPAATLNTQELLRLGNEFYDKKEYAKAVEKYQAILSDSNYVSALNNMGSALSGLGRNEEVIKCYDKAIELKPKMLLHGRTKLMLLMI